MSTYLAASQEFVRLFQAVDRAWWGYLLWIPAAAMLGFAIASIFSTRLRLPRSVFLIPYVLLGGLFTYGYWRWSGLLVTDLLSHNWVWGIIGAVLVGLFVTRNILSQPASAHPTGLTLILDLLWSGVVYGAMDALLLSVVPVLAAWQAFSLLGWTASWPGKLLVGVIALLLSLFVTVCYHLGFSEYRRRGGIAGPAIGNSVMSLGYLLTNNPLSAILSHIAMHIAGVLRGPASVMQLPPHY